MSKLICPTCEDSTLKWLEPDREDLLDNSTMECVGCKAQFIGINGWNEAWQKKNPPKRKCWRIYAYTWNENGGGKCSTKLVETEKELHEVLDHNCKWYENVIVSEFTLTSETVYKGDGK
jgi:hypothetical protein